MSYAKICPIVRTMYRIRDRETGLYYSNTSGGTTRWTEFGNLYTERSHVTNAVKQGRVSRTWKKERLEIVPTVVRMYELESVPVIEWKTKKEGGKWKQKFKKGQELFRELHLAGCVTASKCVIESVKGGVVTVCDSNIKYSAETGWDIDSWMGRSRLVFETHAEMEE